MRSGYPQEWYFLLGKTAFYIVEIEYFLASRLLTLSGCWFLPSNFLALVGKAPLLKYIKLDG
jgi:hypothetical protein